MFSEASYIAMFIGAALQHPLPECNGDNPIMSTIKVHQYKTKFNDVRVYCQLADLALVTKLWQEDGQEGEPPYDFYKKMWIRDAKTYRSSYRAMGHLVSKLEDIDYQANVLNSADYTYLLFDTLDELKIWTENYPEEWYRALNLGGYISNLKEKEWDEIMEKVYST